MAIDFYLPISNHIDLVSIGCVYMICNMDFMLVLYMIYNMDFMFLKAHSFGEFVFRLGPRALAIDSSKLSAL